MSKMFNFDEADVQLEREDGCKLALFDVSPTVECHWVAISSRDYPLLEVVGGSRSMLRYVAKEEADGAKIIDGIDNLNKWVDIDGFETWNEYMADFLGVPTRYTP